MNALNRNEDFRGRPHPTQYELVGPDGKIYGPFDHIVAAGAMAVFHYPGQEQDEDRTGKGWDVQVVGS